MMLIVWTLASAYFINTLSENTSYNVAVRERNQLDIERMSESIRVSTTQYNATANNNVALVAQIFNTGSSSLQFITVWIHVKNSTWSSYNYSKLQIGNVQGGEGFSLNTNMTVIGVKTAGVYEFASWIVTARGTVVALLAWPDRTIILSQATEGIGALMMDFQDFTYYRLNGSSLVGFPTGNSGYVVNSAGSNIAFRMILTNLDKAQRIITLTSGSVFFSTFPTTPTQVRGSYWYIVNVDGTGAVSSTFTNITLPYNVPTAVYFASDHAIISGSPFTGSPSRFTGTSPINLALIGTLGGTPFGQNIPFVSIYVQS